MGVSTSRIDALTHRVRQALPRVMAVYAFGSRVHGTAHADSDLDMAVLVPGYADPLHLWHLASDLADLAGCPVDLLDMRAASTVMQYQILTTGQRWWVGPRVQVDIYEAAMLSEKTELDSARAALLADIARSGVVHDR